MGIQFDMSSFAFAVSERDIYLHFIAFTFYDWIVVVGTTKFSLYFTDRNFLIRIVKRRNYMTSINVATQTNLHMIIQRLLAWELTGREI